MQLWCAVPTQGEVPGSLFDSHGIPGANGETLSAYEQKIRTPVVELDFSNGATDSSSLTGPPKKRARKAIGDRCLNHRRAVWLNHDGVIKKREEKLREYQRKLLMKQLFKEILTSAKAFRKRMDGQEKARKDQEKAIRMEKKKLVEDKENPVMDMQF